MKFIQLCIFIFGCTLLVIISACGAARQVGQSSAQFYEEGNLTVLVCEKPQLEDCQFLSGVNISGSPYKVNTTELPIADNQIRSMSVVCGRPTNVLVYEHCNFRGEVLSFHCTKGTTLEIDHFGALAGKVSSLVFSEEDHPLRRPDGSVDLAAISHIAAPIAQSAIDALHTGISGAIDGSSGGMTITGSPNPSCPTVTRLSPAMNCSVIPQCCTTGGGTGGLGSSRIDSATPLATEVYWTESINIGRELALTNPEPILLPTPDSQCAPISPNTPRNNLFTVVHHTNLDIDNYPGDYPVSLYWYFEPTIDSMGRTFLTLVQSHVQVDPGLIRPQIKSEIEQKMASAGRALACAILSEIRFQGDCAISGGGPAILTGNSRINLAIDDPRTCNTRRVGGSGVGSLLSCLHYRSTPPKLIFHKD